MVTPYFTQHNPPALVATFPPMEQISKLDGSGGYQSPCARAAVLTSTFSAPGWATASRADASISTRRMRSVDRVMHPSTATDPPESPVPAPRVTTGTRCALAQRSAVCTSAVSETRTTAMGRPTSTVFERSNR